MCAHTLVHTKCSMKTPFRNMDPEEQEEQTHIDQMQSMGLQPSSDPEDGKRFMWHVGQLRKGPGVQNACKAIQGM